jgi:streptogramin lyase
MFTRPDVSARFAPLFACAMIASLALASPASAAPSRAAVSASTITSFDTPDLEPLNIAVLPDGDSREDGTPYFTASTEGALPPGELRIGQITSADELATYSARLIQPAQLGQSNLGGITVGPDGNLWFTQQAGTSTQGEGVVYRITPAGSISHQRGVGILSDPSSITSGPDNELWFTENSDQVGSISVHGVVGGPYSTGNGSENLPGDIVALDGNLWVTEASTGQIAELSPQGKLIKQYQVADPSSESGPTYITVGPGATPDLFYVAGDTIGWISTSGTAQGDTSLVGSPYAGFPDQIVTAPDNTVWFTVRGAAQLGQITASGQLLPPITRGVTGATAGIAANSTELWFTEPAAERAVEVGFRDR